jgi:cytochrome c
MTHYLCTLATVLLVLAMPSAAEEIHLAAKNGDVETVQSLLASGTPVDLFSTADTSSVGVSPLWVASKWGRIEVAKVLVEAGANPTLLPAESRISDTPLTIAAGWRRADIVKFFLDNGTDPNSMAYGGTALHKARLGKNQEIVEMLLAAGAKTSIAQPSVEYHLAGADIERGQRLVIKCKVCHADPEVRDPGNASSPILWGIVGRAKASQPGMEYSQALTDFGGYWTFDDLNSYLALPGAYVPGTYMGYIDLIDRQQDRVDIIAYLRTLSDNPVPLP